MFDVCANRKIDPQTELDTNFIAKALHDGRSDVHKMFDEYQDALKTRDNFPKSAQPFMTDNQVVMSALYCKDPDDVKIVTKPADLGPNKEIDFSIDFWRANTNEIFETARGHEVTPALIAGANKALNENIPAHDRDRAVAQFNDRARTENQPMEIVLERQTGQLQLQVADSKVTASK
jgi:hypothetical protein